ncbi:hypothetical protein PAEPH01_1550 [Pancytospora epiphaga]|nr:hypothetical protein PAEPH01_1550 [Pancytospora epiphaga]
MMKCEICGAQYRQIGADLVCMNGHALQNTLEVVDDEFGAFKGRRRRIRQQKEVKKSLSGLHSSVERFILARRMFYDAARFIGISSDKIYRYFTAFFYLSKENDSDNNIKIEGDFVISTQTVMAIIYLSKRSEMEAKGIPYFYKDFRAEILKFKVNDKLKLYFKEYKIDPSVHVGMIIHGGQICIITALNQIRNIADFDVFIKRRIECSEVHASGAIPLNTENARFNIRRLFSRDPKLFLQYFEGLCNDLGVEITDDLSFYFHKYVYTFDYRRLLFPDFAFVIFIGNYFSEKSVFGNTELEGRILQFFKTTKHRLLSFMNASARCIIDYRSPEMLIQSREVDNAMRFINLRRAIWLIDVFKERRKLEEEGF